MCGIAGIYTFGNGIQDGHIEKMVMALEHRGPDHMGFVRHPRAHLGSRRLSIIDVRNGNQPIFNEDKTIVTVLNGEIYNYKEIRHALAKKRHQFKTDTDTEVLVHLFEEQGPGMVRELEGQFAFAIYDKRKNDLFLFRDRMGICPLYYIQVKNNVYFSSEIKSFAQLDWFRNEPDIIGLAQSLKYWSTISPRTVFANVSSLPIAHFLKISPNRGIEIERYHSITQYHQPLSARNRGELNEEIRTALTEAVRKRLVSDESVKIGAYVSGGVDSTIITHLIDQIGLNDFTTYSIAFDDPSCDESTYQRDCVKNLRSNHVEVNISYDQIPEAFPETVCHTEFPFFRTAPVPMYILSKAVNDSERKVVLSGEGADEIFYGYDVFKELIVRKLWANNRESRIRSGMLRDVFYYDDMYENPTAFAFLKKFYEGTLADNNNDLYSLLAQWQNGAGLFNFFTPENREIINARDLDGEIISLLPDDFSGLSDLKKCQALQMELLLGGYLLSSQGDRVLNANSVEGRYPFLDESVVSLAYNIPGPLKMYGLNEKYILRDAFKGIIPESIRGRKKFPYRAPEAKVFFGKKQPDYVEELLSKRAIEEVGVFNYNKVRMLRNKFTNNDDITKFSTRDNIIMIFVLGTQLLMKSAGNKFQPMC